MRRRTLISTLSVATLVCVLYFISAWPAWGLPIFDTFDDEATRGEDGLIALPLPYSSFSHIPEELGTCAERYGTHYIRKYSDSAINLCDNTTTTGLTCFTFQSHDERIDSFCIGAPAVIDPQARTIEMHCPQHEWNDEEATRNVVQLEQFPLYWYGTGVRAIFDEYINLDGGASSQPDLALERTALLVKREETVDNLWHTLMQVMSLWLSLDILRTTIDPATQKPFYGKRDVAGTQAIILDHWDDGAFFDLWNMFGGIPTARLADVDPLSLSASKIVVPLPGGSNPFWQGDWVDLNCRDSVLLRAFSQRMLDYYEIPPSTTQRSRLKMVFVDRRGQRGLDNQQALLSALQAEYPHVTIELVDFAGLPMAEQLRTVRNADILAGVHGAGLTHGMFLQESSRSTVVEILPPDVKHKGFKNMARFLGHRYYSAHGTEQWYEGKSGEWHEDKVFIDQHRFLALLGAAISNASG